jgi:CheY-like chemotaxis protein
MDSEFDRSWNNVARILVIDDNEETRLMLEEALVLAGHEVVLAADGKEGMRQYRLKPADVVITDLFMPNQEGLETIVGLMRQWPDTAIIAISGNFEASSMLLVARQLGATEVLQKPFFPDELIGVVEKVLQLKRAKVVS